MAKIIILNGPPGCGKDTLAKLFVLRNPEYKVDCFKDHLYSETAAYFGVDRSELVNRHEDRDLKEVPWHPYRGVKISTRKMLIVTSENVIKPYYGKDYFGVMKGTQWKQEKNSYIISDGGFSEETNAVCDKVGAENVIIIRLHRIGFNFSGDSRSYITERESRCRTKSIILQHGKILKACKKIEKVISL